MANETSFGGGTGTILDHYPMPPSAALIGFRIIEFDRAARTMRVGFEASDGLLNPAGTVQGGFYGVMLDEAMGSLVVALQDGKLRPATTDLHVQYFKPAFPGPLEARSRITRMGKSMVFTEGDLLGPDGSVLGHAVMTAKLVPTER